MRAKCPKCGGGLAVKKTHNKAGVLIRRKRSCKECDLIVYTTEAIRAVQGTLLGG